MVNSASTPNRINACHTFEGTRFIQGIRIDTILLGIIPALEGTEASVQRVKKVVERRAHHYVADLVQVHRLRFAD